jgi:hypothetical protein
MMFKSIDKRPSHFSEGYTMSTVSIATPANKNTILILAGEDEERGKASDGMTGCQTCNSDGRGQRLCYAIRIVAITISCNVWLLLAVG